MDSLSSVSPFQGGPGPVKAWDTIELPFDSPDFRCVYQGDPASREVQSTLRAYLTPLWTELLSQTQLPPEKVLELCHFLVEKRNVKVNFSILETAFKWATPPVWDYLFDQYKVNNALIFNPNSLVRFVDESMGEPDPKKIEDYLSL